MSELTTTVSFEDYTGQRCEVEIDLSDYKAAAEDKKSLTQYYAEKYPTNENQLTAMEQFCMSSGIRVRPDVKRGIPATNMDQIIHGFSKSAGTVVRGTGVDRQGVAGRLLFPEIVLQLANEVLTDSKDDYLIPFEGSFAERISVAGPRVDQPLVNVTAPEGSAAMPIAQLALPAVMVSITLNEKSYTIPTKSIGLEVADQALQTTTIDFVTLTIAAQARGERIRRLEEDLVNIISGDVDYNIPAVTFTAASVYDPALGTNKLTHKAWVKWLWANYRKMSLSHLITSDDGILDIDARAGRPTAQTDTSQDGNRVPGGYSLANAATPQPTVLRVPTSVIGADRVVGFDRRFALRETTNVSASYSAIENFVLRRAVAFRLDYGVIVTKIMNEAFQGLTLGA